MPDRTAAARSTSINSRTFDRAESQDNRGCSRGRSKSPGKLLMQVHDRLIEESKSKDALAQELNSMKRRIEEFSIRLDFILKCSPLPQTCVLHVKELNDELNNFVLQSCMTRNDDVDVVSDAYHSIKRLFDRSEEERLLVESERNELLRTLAGMTVQIGSNEATDTFEEEAEQIRRSIVSLKNELVKKRCLIDELKRAYESQIHSMESVNREEVRNLREALAKASAHSDKWKSMYLADVPRLRDELTKLNLADTVETSRRTIPKSC